MEKLRIEGTGRGTGRNKLKFAKDLMERVPDS